MYPWSRLWQYLLWPLLRCCCPHHRSRQYCRRWYGLMVSFWQRPITTASLFCSEQSTMTYWWLCTEISAYHQFEHIHHKYQKKMPVWNDCLCLRNRRQNKCSLVSLAAFTSSSTSGHCHLHRGPQQHCSRWHGPMTSLWQHLVTTVGLPCSGQVAMADWLQKYYIHMYAVCRWPTTVIWKLTLQFLEMRFKADPLIDNSKVR